MMLRRACRVEAAKVFHMIEERIAWMERSGMKAWNRSDYLSIFPLSYFESMAEDGILYVLAEGDDIFAAAVILESDERWPEGGSAMYIHNLVARDDRRGAGRKLIERAEELARERGKAELRLDAATGNEPLLDYYHSMDFIDSGYCTAGTYEGTRLRKLLY